MLIDTLRQLLVLADLGVGAAVATARAQMRADPAFIERFQRTSLTALRTVLGCATVLGLIALGVGLAGAWPSLLDSDGTRSSGKGVGLICRSCTRC
jgi:hypothetical protein